MEQSCKEPEGVEERLEGSGKRGGEESGRLDAGEVVQVTELLRRVRVVSECPVARIGLQSRTYEFRKTAKTPVASFSSMEKTKERTRARSTTMTTTTSEIYRLERHCVRHERERRQV